MDATWVAPEKPETPKPANVPVPTQAKENVVSLLSGAYPAATGFGIGGWNQSTQVTNMNIGDAPVEYIEYFNYLGWELAQHLDVSECTHMHVDYWTANETGGFGFTPISPGAEKPYIAPAVKANEWNSYDVPLTHWDNVNFKDLFQVKFDQGNGQQSGYIANVYFYKEASETPVDPVDPSYGNTYEGKTSGVYSQTMESGETVDYPYELNYAVTYNEDKTLTVKGDFVWSDKGKPVGTETFMYIIINGIENHTATGEATTAQTYEEGQNVRIEFKVPCALGAIQPGIDYIVGSKGIVTGVAEIADENAPVEYYNLNGIRVANPENGIFIRRQGNKVTKVII